LGFLIKKKGRGGVLGGDSGKVAVGVHRLFSGRVPSSLTEFSLFFLFFNKTFH
jgi:hypothetical protein